MNAEWIDNAVEELFLDAAERFPMNGDCSADEHEKDIARVKRGFAAIISKHANTIPLYSKTRPSQKAKA